LSRACDKNVITYKKKPKVEIYTALAKHVATL